LSEETLRAFRQAAAARRATEARTWLPAPSSWRLTLGLVLGVLGVSRQAWSTRL
jgi:hypothetical protein